MYDNILLMLRQYPFELDAIKYYAIIIHMERKISDATLAANKVKYEAIAQARAAEFRELLQIEEPEAIFAPDAGVAGRIIKNTNDGTERLVWTPPALSDEYATGQQTSYTIKETAAGNPIVGASGGKARDLAAVHLAKAFPNAIVVPMSRFEVPKNETTRAHVEPPTEHYEVNAKYIQRHGVAPERIIPEKESTTIFEGIIQMFRMCRERGIKNAVFVTNDYNVPRAEAMIQALMSGEAEIQKKLAYLIGNLNEKYLEILGLEVDNNGQAPKVSVKENAALTTQGVTITVVPAETVLEAVNPENKTSLKTSYRAIIEATHNTDAYKNRVISDQNGARQIEDGTYGKGAWEARYKKN